jgi:CelD/BcsL family acetyltransferase involved in cellulose biosynthesis
MIHTCRLGDRDITLRCSSDVRDFASIWPRSDRLGDACCYVFQCADFIEVWCDTIGKARKTEPCLVGVFDERDHPLMLLALGVEARYGVRVLTFLDGGVSDYNAPVLFAETLTQAEDLIRGIWDALRAVVPPFDITLLEKIPEKVHGLANPMMRLAPSKYASSGHIVTLSGGWDEYVAKRLPRKQDTRRKLRRLAELGKVHFTIADTPEERAQLVEAMIAQKSRRYMETRGTDSFDRPGYRRFFREATARLGAGGGSVQLSALALDGEVLAAHWGCVVGGRYYYLMPSYAGGEWQRFSPGRLLLNHLIEWSIKSGMTIFDQGIGEEDYKDEYCDVVLELYQIEAPLTLRGRVLLLPRRAKEALRRLGLLDTVKAIVRDGRHFARWLRGLRNGPAHADPKPRG